jgi:hypothetical protein
VSQAFPEPEADNVPSLLPVQEEPLDAQEEFDRFEESFNEAQRQPDLVVQEEPPHPVGRGWAFDFLKREFVIAPTSHGPLETIRIETLRNWIEKCLRTARGTYPIYSDDYGIETPGDFIGGPVSQFPDQVYEDAIREALTAHERITEIDQFEAVYDPMEEWVSVNFVVVLDDETRFPIQNVVLEPV